MTTAQHLLTGRAGEDAAAALLQSKGLILLVRNWRQGSLELDIVAEEGDTLIFVEVKTRAADGLQRPHEALTAAKRSLLTRAATRYLMEHNLWHRPCRFDLVSVVVRGRETVAEHIPNAFDLTPALDRRHAAWQPW